MSRILIFLFIFLSFSAEASWHHLGKITKVTVMGDHIYVRGDSPSGHVCTDLNGFYGTMSIARTQPGFSEYYSMALAGYAAGKSMSCHVTSVRSDGVCEMTNCHLK